MSAALSHILSARTHLTSCTARLTFVTFRSGNFYSSLTLSFNLPLSTPILCPSPPMKLYIKLQAYVLGCNPHQLCQLMSVISLHELNDLICLKFWRSTNFPAWEVLFSDPTPPIGFSSGLPRPRLTLCISPIWHERSVSHHCLLDIFTVPVREMIP